MTQTVSTQHAFAFAGETVCIVGETALWWPSRRALLVADLHFEKASWFAQRGQMLPPYDSLATLTRLAALARALEAQHIYCLGDNFHDDDGAERLPAEPRAMVENLVRDHGLSWIVGNHDPNISARVPGPVFAERMLGAIVLRHEAIPDAVHPEISGHFHPKARIKVAAGLGAKIISRPSFVVGNAGPADAPAPGRLILPAFGALTGGLDVTADPIATLFPHGYRALIASGPKLLAFPFSVTESDERAQLSLWHK